MTLLYGWASSFSRLKSQFEEIVYFLPVSRSSWNSFNRPRIDERLWVDFEDFGIKAKRRITKRVCQENKARQSFRKTNISYPLIRTLRSHVVCVLGGKKCSFFGNFGVSCFLEKSVLRFALLPHYRRRHPVVLKSGTLTTWPLPPENYFFPWHLGNTDGRFEEDRLQKDFNN